MHKKTPFLLVRPFRSVLLGALLMQSETRIEKAGFRSETKNRILTSTQLKKAQDYAGLGSNAGKQRPKNVWAGVVVRPLAVYWGSVRLCCRASCG